MDIFRYSTEHIFVILNRSGVTRKCDKLTDEQTDRQRFA